jgi:hypothetical protein
MSHQDVSDSSRPGVRPSTRYGPAAIVREAPASEDVELVALFGSEAGGSPDLEPPAPAFVERRRWRRFPAIEHRAWLGWWAGPRQFTTVAARLEDISQGGAKLTTADPPAAGQIVWLCLGIPEPCECVQAKVVATSPTPEPEGGTIVRLAFGTLCPEKLYRIAIHGLAQR